MDVRVWVGCLAHYNNGDLIGEWLDASEAGDWVCPRKDPSDVYLNCEETWVMDHEIPGVNGEMDPMTAVKWAGVFAEVEDYEADAFAAWMGMETRQPDDDTYTRFRDAYHGEWAKPEDHAWSFVEDQHLAADIPQPPAFFSFSFNEDEWDQDYTFIDGHVFSNYE